MQATIYGTLCSLKISNFLSVDQEVSCEFERGIMVKGVVIGYTCNI